MNLSWSHASPVVVDRVVKRVGHVAPDNDFGVRVELLNDRRALLLACSHYLSGRDSRSVAPFAPTRQVNLVLVYDVGFRPVEFLHGQEVLRRIFEHVVV